MKEKLKTIDVNTIILMCILMHLLVFESNAQCVQKCVVMEYNETEKKSPLGGVEVLVINAGSTISDSNGNVTLKFRTQKPGDKVTVRRIEKSGYEIFNKDALTQWNITKEGVFQIVMCRSDRFKQIRDNYFAISSASYAKQRKAEEAKLQALKKQGRIKQAEYEKEIARIEEEYEQRLMDIDAYIDRFARIDLSELSAEEAKAIELFRNGDIEGAIKAYEDMKLEEQYFQSVKNYLKAERAADSLGVIQKKHEELRDSINAAIIRRDKLKKRIK